MILALDLATSTGWAYGRGDSPPAVGALRLPSTGANCGEFGSAFWKWFDPLMMRLIAELEDGENLVVAFEAPILPDKKWNPITKKMEGGTQILTTRKLQGLAMLVELSCEFWKEDGAAVVCQEVVISTAKKELAGHGHADKGQMILAARRAGIHLSTGAEASDEADAFGIWLVALRHHAPQHLSRWDKVLWGTRR